MPNWLEMRDSWTFKIKDVESSKRHLFECRDSQSDTGHSLLVHMAATHAGIVNGNMRFYRPDKMQDGVHTWLPQLTKDGVVLRTPRPVLIKHDEHGDVLGRVLTAKYVDESWKYANDFPMIKDFLFYQRDGKKRHDLFKSVDWVVNNLMPMDDYTGLGYTDLGVRITNPDAIRKVLADEYLTVSVGFKTDSALCSICHTDWAEDGKCEHKLGQKVDGKPMFLISGCFDNQEVSFINFAADPFATTLGKEVLNDSLAKMFFLGLTTKEQSNVAAGSLLMTDSLYESDIVVTEEPMEQDTVTMDPVKVREEVKAADLTAEKAKSLKALLVGWQPETDELKAERRSLVSTINARIRKNGWDAVTVQDDQIAAELTQLVADSAEVHASEEKPPECEVCSWDGWDQEASEDDKVYFADVDGINEELEMELDAAIAAGELPSQDAKLSTESRKKLSGSTFCGPGRSFPVPDCAHVTAARRLIGRAKVSDATKTKILACVSSKASRMSCGGAKKDGSEAAVQQATTDVSDEINTLAVSLKFLDADAGDEAGTAKEVLGLYTGLDKFHGKASDSLRYKMADMHAALGEKWGKDRWYEYCRQSMSAHKDYVVLTKTEAADKDEALNGLMVEKDVLIKENTTLRDSRAAVLMASKRTLAQQIVMHGTLTGQDAYKDLTPDQLEEKINDLTKRHISSLKDTVQDILSGMRWTKNTDSVSTTTTSLKPMDNNVRVTDNVQVGSSTTEPIRNQAEDLASRERLLLKLRYMTGPQKDRYLADLAYESANANKVQ